MQLDETPDNSFIFLDVCNGMDSLMKCVEFNKAEICRNMMGLLVDFYI